MSLNLPVLCLCRAFEPDLFSLQGTNTGSSPATSRPRTPARPRPPTALCRHAVDRATLPRASNGLPSARARDAHRQRRPAPCLAPAVVDADQEHLELAPATRANPAKRRRSTLLFRLAAPEHRAAARRRRGPALSLTTRRTPLELAFSDDFWDILPRPIQCSCVVHLL